ncbi:MAG: TerD family protein [Deinococcales bacterium]
MVNSFTGQSFDQVENAFCRLVDRNSNQEIARFNLSAQGSHTAMIMTNSTAKLVVGSLLRLVKIVREELLNPYCPILNPIFKFLFKLLAYDKSLGSSQPLSVSKRIYLDHYPVSCSYCHRHCCFDLW